MDDLLLLFWLLLAAGGDVGVGEMAVYFDIIKVLFREHKSILGESIPLDRHAFINFPDKLILTFICFSV